MGAKVERDRERGLTLRPPRKVPLLDVDLEDVSDDDSRPDVGHVGVRSVGEHSVEDDGDVDLGELGGRPSSSEEVERDREERSDQEAVHEAGVDSVVSEHPLGSEGSPEDGRGEEGVLSVADESVLLERLADVRDRHLVVENCGRDEARDRGTVDRERAKARSVTETDD